MNKNEEKCLLNGYLGGGSMKEGEEENGQHFEND